MLSVCRSSNLASGSAMMDSLAAATTFTSNSANLQVDNSKQQGGSELVNGIQSKPELIWHVRNREGYNPRIYHPYDVAFLWDNRAVVVEGFYPYSRIQVLDNSGKCIKSIAQGDIMPYGITIDAEGYMAITDHKDRTVKFFTPDGQFGLSWQSDMFDWPDGIAATTAGHYVVTDWTRGTVSIHDIDGVRIRAFTSADPEADTHFSCPAYVTLDKHQRIILTDTSDHSVKIFDQTGKLLQKFGNLPAGSPGTIKDPRGITTDKNNNIVVADWGKNAVSLFSSDGSFITHLLTDDDNIKYPWGVAMNDSGQLLMSEQKLDSNPGLKLYQCH